MIKCKRLNIFSTIDDEFKPCLNKPKDIETKKSEKELERSLVSFIQNNEKFLTHHFEDVYGKKIEKSVNIIRVPTKELAEIAMKEALKKGIFDIKIIIE